MLRSPDCAEQPLVQRVVRKPSQSVICSHAYLQKFLIGFRTSSGSLRKWSAPMAAAAHNLAMLRSHVAHRLCVRWTASSAGAARCRMSQSVRQLTKSAAGGQPLRPSSARPVACPACPHACDALSLQRSTRTTQQLRSHGHQCPAQLQGRHYRQRCCSVRAAAAAVEAEGVSATTGAQGAVGPNVVQLLRERGLVADVTSPELEKLAADTSLKIYCGFDPTADSLHLGNLLGVLVLAWFQRCGLPPMVISIIMIGMHHVWPCIVRIPKRRGQHNYSAH